MCNDIFLYFCGCIPKLDLLQCFEWFQACQCSKGLCLDLVYKSWNRCHHLEYVHPVPDEQVGYDHFVIFGGFCRPEKRWRAGSRSISLKWNILIIYTGQIIVRFDDNKFDRIFCKTFYTKLTFIAVIWMMIQDQMMLNLKPRV